MIITCSAQGAMRISFADGEQRNKKNGNLYFMSGEIFVVAR